MDLTPKQAMAALSLSATDKVHDLKPVAIF